MRHVKTDCHYAPTRSGEPCKSPQIHEAHPSWIAGIDALSAYGDWVSSILLPIAFQWIEEHKPEVYATIPEEYRDDIGVVTAAAFKLVEQLPACQIGRQKSVAYEAAQAAGTWNSSKTNPVWTSIAEKIRDETSKAFAEKSALIGDCPK
jgi:hypothetical protein